jgi:MYXO-CTERM domain-containing protein
MLRMRTANIRLCFAAFFAAHSLSGEAIAADVPATPADYQAKLSSLKAGDVLKLAAGDYTSGMNIVGMNGSAGMPIVIQGPASGAPARFVGKSGKNTIDIKNSSHVTIQNLVLDGQDISGIDAIKAGGQASDFAHHITIEGCTITKHSGGGSSQQTVGVSTKIVTWDWIVRGNLIDGAGTGMYFGNSDGSRAFIGGVIEGNLFRDTLGYNMQIKHQTDRGQSAVPQVPTDDRVTVVRHNVFIKSNNPSPDGARPNLLVDGPPASGPGSKDWVEIYGNFFFHNDDDALFQGNGRLHIHDNVFVDSKHPAIRLTNHSGKTVIDAWVYNNTIFDTATGISVSSAPSGNSLIFGNAIFSAQPLAGSTTGQKDNVTDSVANAGNYVVAPSKSLGQMDFYPKTGSALKAAAMDYSGVQTDTDYDLDFNGTQKNFSYRGAYQGEGTNPGWALADDFKSGTGTAGNPGTGGTGGGSGGSGGSAGGSAGQGAAVGLGGASGSGASTGSGGSAGTPSSASGDDGGCGCRTGRGGQGGHRGAWALLLIGMAAAFGRWRRANG